MKFMFSEVADYHGYLVPLYAPLSQLPAEVQARLLQEGISQAPQWKNCPLSGYEPSLDYAWSYVIKCCCRGRNNQAHLRDQFLPKTAEHHYWEYIKLCWEHEQAAIEYYNAATKITARFVSIFSKEGTCVSSNQHATASSGSPSQNKRPWSS